MEWAYKARRHIHRRNTSFFPPGAAGSATAKGLFEALTLLLRASQKSSRKVYQLDRRDERIETAKQTTPHCMKKTPQEQRSS
ncbi:hypothetical protein GCM10010096_15510 [Alcaligenes pakistanensis]|uniref:Uncharacterized protein n=1 Tax=Alcaligenes pakistanensis TaxID=1482717 RepID=A0A8H9IH17_9BURK|nr:hypothetical protein GCM10010096_15510 [Alcaligenes pakistanensis]